MNHAQQRRISPWQCVILFLSVYVLAALLIETLFPLPVEVVRLLAAVDVAVCAAFAADFCLQLKASKPKWAYLLKWGWLDLISSIPTLPFLRIGRLARLIRILRLLRGVRSARVIITHLFENRARGTFATVALIAFVLIVFSSIAVLNVESAAGSTIKTAEDALWWSIATVTTVGYGDVYPTTTAGRLVAAVLMIAGVALFGTFTAAVASFFVQQDKRREEDKPDTIPRQLHDLSERLERLEKTNDGQQASPPSSESAARSPRG